jgi:hypothetical protein
MPNACEAQAVQSLQSTRRFDEQRLATGRQAPPPWWYSHPCPYLDMLQQPLSLEATGPLPKVLEALSSASGVPVTVARRDTQPCVSVRVRGAPAVAVLRALCSATGEPPPSKCEEEELALGHGVAVSAFFARLTVATRLALLTCESLDRQWVHLWTLPSSLAVVDFEMTHLGLPLRAAFCYAYDGDVVGFIHAAGGAGVQECAGLADEGSGGTAPEPGSFQRRMVESRVSFRFPQPHGPLGPPRGGSWSHSGWAVQPFGATIDAAPNAGGGAAAPGG